MQLLQEKTVLVTGGTGSFGKTVAAYLLANGAREVRIFSRDEEKQDAMRNRNRNTVYKYFIGDVRDRASVDHAMKGVDMVFHAAALKQVPSCEFFPLQAMQTNIIGSSNVVESAIIHQVSSVVCLSTDKAVFPVNAMGMSKAMMEKVVQAASRGIHGSPTTLSCVRYGNVMYSRGSVIPLFLSQIRSGQSLTITHPDMTRFLMPLSAAVELVLYALTNANQGDTFVKKAPAATVLDLAQAMKNVFASDVDIKTIGIRHGEKMYETLVSSEELTRSSDLGDYYRVALDARSLDYNRFFTDGDPEIENREEYNSDNTYRLSVAEIEKLLVALPEVQAELASDDGRAFESPGVEI